MTKASSPEERVPTGYSPRGAAPRSNPRGWRARPRKSNLRKRRRSGPTTKTTCTACSSSAALEAEHGETAAHVGKKFDAPVVVEHDALEYADRARAAEGLEVADGAQVQVGRVVPLVGKLRRYRHAPAQHLQPQSPVAEIRKGHDAFPPHAQHLADDLFGMARRLQ